MIFDMRKPIYGNTYAIRNKWLFKAKKLHKTLRINYPGGITTISPTRFLKDGEMIEMFYNDPTTPMILYKLSLVPDKEQPEIVEDYSVPDMVRERLRERAVELGLTKKYEQRNLL